MCLFKKKNCKFSSKNAEVFMKKQKLTAGCICMHLVCRLCSGINTTGTQDALQHPHKGQGRRKSLTGSVTEVVHNFEDKLCDQVQSYLHLYDVLLTTCGDKSPGQNVTRDLWPFCPEVAERSVWVQITVRSALQSWVRVLSLASSNV